MLDKIMQMAEGPLGDMLKDKAGIPTDKVDDAVKVSGNSFMDTLKGDALGGNLGGIASMVLGKSDSNSSNSFVDKAVANMASDFVQKLGLSKGIADMAAKFAVPFIMDKVMGGFKETDDADDDEGVANFLGLDAGKLLGGAGKSLLGDSKLGKSLGGLLD